MQLSVKRLTDTAKLPTKAYEDDAGIDIYSDVDVMIRPGQTVKVSTGIAIQLPTIWNSGHETAANFIWDRSSMGVKGIHRLAGCCDLSYIGEVTVVLTNLNVEPLLTKLAMTGKVTLEDIMEHTYHIKQGDKIAQLVLQKVQKLPIVEVEELFATERGEKGFGSTGT